MNWRIIVEHSDDKQWVGVRRHGTHVGVEVKESNSSITHTAWLSADEAKALRKALSRAIRDAGEVTP